MTHGHFAFSALCRLPVVAWWLAIRSLGRVFFCGSGRVAIYPKADLKTDRLALRLCHGVPRGETVPLFLVHR